MEKKVIKTSIILSYFLAICSGSLISQNLDSYQDNLVMYFPFDGNAREALSQSDGLVSSGVSPVQDQYGNERGALELDGKSGYIRIPHRESIDFVGSDSYTISIWVNAQSAKSSIFEKWPLIKTGYPLTIRTGNLESNKVVTGVARYGGEPKPYATHRVFTYDEANRMVSTEKWNLLTFVCKGNIEQLYYINGKVVGSCNDKYGNSIRNSGEILIGALFFESKGGFYQFLKGKVDDMRIYNKALSEEAVLELYNINQ